VPQAYNNRGLALQALAKRDDALRDFSKAIQLKRDYAEAHYNQGNVLREKGQLNEAGESFARAIAINAAIPEFHNGVGVLLKDRKDWQGALRNFDKALSLRPNYLDAMVNRGNALRELGLLPEALAACDSALKLNPAHAEACGNRGNVLQQLGRYLEAIAAFDRAISLKPGYAEAHLNRGNALKELLRFQDALASYDRAISVRPDYVEAHISRGAVLRELGLLDEAVASYQTAQALDPRHAGTWFGLARIDAELGNFAEAERKYIQARQLDPQDVSSLIGMADVRKYEAGDPIVTAIEDSLQRNDLPAQARGLLHHALAKIRNDQGAYDEAFTNYAISKRHLNSKFDMDTHLRGYAMLKDVFSPAFFAERAGFGNADERPVFIVGMPRSGTTLAEQILASHHRAEGLGELTTFPDIMARLGGGLQNPLQFRQAVLGLSAADVNRLAEDYLAVYRGHSGDTLRFIDKRPHNFEWLGMIALLFPRAHVIHCRRNPLDNCVSMFMQNFNATHGYNQDLETLGQYYVAYEGLMQHWDGVLPIPMRDCVYETVVGNLEESARALVAFLGLDWDPACLNYHETDRRVNTPSRWQVRQPLYDKSVGRWRRYGSHLEPLKTALGLSA
jgi:tetratricopeptide (TPR) repeat protein